MFFLKNLSFIMQIKCLNVEWKFYFFNDETSFFLSLCLKHYFQIWSQDPTKYTYSNPKWSLLTTFALLGWRSDSIFEFLFSKVNSILPKVLNCNEAIIWTSLQLEKIRDTNFHILQVYYITHNELISILYEVQNCVKMHL